MGGRIFEEHEGAIHVTKGVHHGYKHASAGNGLIKRRCGEIHRRGIARALVFDVFTTKGPEKEEEEVVEEEVGGRAARDGRGRAWRESDLCPMRVRCRRRSWKRAGRLKRGPRLRHRAIFGAPGPSSEDLLPYLRFARPLSPSNKVNQPVFRYYPRATVRRRDGGGDPRRV